MISRSCSTLNLLLMYRECCNFSYTTMIFFLEINRNLLSTEKSRAKSTEMLGCADIINPLNAELNPIRHLLALVGAHHIVHVSGIMVKLVLVFENVSRLTQIVASLSLRGPKPHPWKIRVNLWWTK